MSEYILTADGQIYRADYYNEELYHYGTKGMKWGVRKYQNEDGSLTAAGKSRYSTVADAKEAYRKAKKSSSDKYSRATGGGYGRFTVTKDQRKNYSRDVQAFNNSLASRTSAKYDYKIAKAQQKGKNDKVANLRAKQEFAVNKQKARTSIANTYLRDTYERQSLGKQIVHNMIGGNKGTVNALVKAGYSERGAKAMSYIFNDSTNLSLAYAKSDRNVKKQMKSQNS